MKMNSEIVRLKIKLGSQVFEELDFERLEFLKELNE